MLTTKDKILNACRKLLVKDRINYLKITVADICDVAGIGRKTFYRYYSSKDRAYQHLIERDVQGFGEIIDGIEALEISPVEKINMLNRQFIKTYTEDFTADFIDQMCNYCTPELLAFKAGKEAEVLLKFRKVIQEGIDDGSFRKDINPDFVVYIINAISYAINNRPSSNDKIIQPALLIEQLYDIILHGIMNKTVDRR